MLQTHSEASLLQAHEQRGYRSSFLQNFVLPIWIQFRLKQNHHEIKQRVKVAESPQYGRDWDSAWEREEESSKRTDDNHRMRLSFEEEWTAIAIQ
jgi:hypothetical protein